MICLSPSATRLAFGGLKRLIDPGDGPIADAPRSAR
jgi:hypothetical protein